jgi:hypothetical protein
MFNSTIVGPMNDNIDMYSTIIGSMNDNIDMYSTIVGPMNDNIDMYSTIVGPMNENPTSFVPRPKPGPVFPTPCLRLFYVQ